MNKQEMRRYEMLKRVRDFASTYSNQFVAGSLGQELFGVVGNVVNELSDQSMKVAATASNARQGKDTKATVRTELLERMKAVSDTARSMSVRMSSVDEKFRMPRTGTSQEGLISAAQAFVTNATPLVNEFIKYEMPADFLDQLKTVITAFEQSISQKNLLQQSKTEASGTIDTALERGMSAVKELDSIIKNKFRKDAAVLNVWEQAKHVDRAPRTPKPSSNGETPQSTPGN